MSNKLREAVSKGKVAAILMWLLLLPFVVIRAVRFCVLLPATGWREFKNEWNSFLVDWSTIVSMSISHWRNKRCRHDSIEGYCTQCHIDRLIKKRE